MEEWREGGILSSAVVMTSKDVNKLVRNAAEVIARGGSGGAGWLKSVEDEPVVGFCSLNLWWGSEPMVRFCFWAWLSPSVNKLLKSNILLSDKVCAPESELWLCWLSFATLLFMQSE